MIKRLVIDDYRTFLFDATHIRDVFNAYNFIVDEEWDEIWWDFDMGMEGGDSTLALARYLEANPELVIGRPVMHVHSSNPIGAQRLMWSLEKNWKTKRVSRLQMSKLVDYSNDEEEWE